MKPPPNIILPDVIIRFRPLFDTLEPSDIPAIEAKYYHTEKNHGRLYPNLDDMVESGLVEKDKKDNRTNEYSLTKRGQRKLEARREWGDGLIEFPN